MNGVYELKCSECGAVLKIDELFMAQMGREFEEENRKKLQEAIDFQKKHLAEEAKKDSEEAIRKATEAQEKRIAELMEQVKMLTEANQTATKEMMEFQKKQFELQQAAQKAELEAQKKLNDQAAEIYEKAKKEAEEAAANEIASLKKKVEDANQATEDVKRKLQQGSQQLQGEIQELKLEDCLRMEFPLDTIEEVEKGKLGADVIQTVVSRSGKTCGKIVWESKNVKNWSNAFIPKLREDMSRVSGDVGILVSNVFGKDMAEFSPVEGVWLVKPINALSMARVVREMILSVSEAKMVAEHKETVEDAVYAFVTSPAFRNRMENIGRQYRALDAEIDKTKDSMIKHWETQRKLIDELVGNTQGILGEVNAFLIQADNKVLLGSEENQE